MSQKNLENNVLPNLKPDEYYHISQQGLARIAQIYDPQDPIKNLVWTTDYTIEMPIRMKKFGPGSEQPQTLIEKFQKTLAKFGDKPALTVKNNNKWQSITFKQYYEECCNFAKGLLSLGISQQKAVNIIGFNAPQWFIAFYGSIFGFFLPVGVYTTNESEACKYVAEHSECEVVVVENRGHLAKYLKIWDQLPGLKYIVMYNDVDIPEAMIPNNRKKQVLQWKQLIELGKNYKNLHEQDSLEHRMTSQKPGHCCTLVYTSGTTGQPKGVMLSHDNYVFPGQTLSLKYVTPDEDQRIVSYLPLSHVAAQVIDLVVTMIGGMNVFFAAPDALQGSLITTLQDVRPTFFFSVPRVWEKIEEKMKQIALSNGFVKRSIATWAKGMGKQGTFAETHGQSPPICFGVAKALVFNNVKKALGLDQAKYTMFGAAPLSPVIREYFLSLNIFLINAYGMSECAGAQTISVPENFDQFDAGFLQSTGRGIEGSEIKIMNPDKDGNGEICYRGRHVFKGYLKNEQASRETLDYEGYLRSGDVGKLDKNGNLLITGRIKELIITAGGENIAPVLIEIEVKEALTFLSNCMVIGEARKFLVIILTLKHVVDKSGRVTSQLENDVLAEFKNIGSKATNVKEANECSIIKKKIDQGIDQANKKAISKAHYIRKWQLIDGDFSVDGGELTPTLKLKRKVVQDKHQGVIQQMYFEAKL